MKRSNMHYPVNALVAIDLWPNPRWQAAYLATISSHFPPKCILRTRSCRWCGSCAVISTAAPIAAATLVTYICCHPVSSHSSCTLNHIIPPSIRRKVCSRGYWFSFKNGEMRCAAAEGRSSVVTTFRKENSQKNNSTRTEFNVCLICVEVTDGGGQHKTLNRRCEAFRVFSDHAKSILTQLLSLSSRKVGSIYAWMDGGGGSVVPKAITVVDGIFNFEKFWKISC